MVETNQTQDEQRQPLAVPPTAVLEDEDAESEVSEETTYAANNASYTDEDTTYPENETPYADNAKNLEGTDFDQAQESIWTRIKWGRIALALIFVFLVLAACLFAWNRWYRFDDVQDIQGTWRDVHTGNTMEVNATYIKLNEDAVYEYQIDTVEKSIHYSFGNTEGFSSYRFSEDRTLLVLEDGADTDWSLVLHFYDDPGFAEGELPDGTTRLEKISSEVPNISVPGSNRPKSPLDHGPSSRLESSASSSAASSNAFTDVSSSASSLEDESASTEEEPPQASQTVPDANGLVVSPDRNSKGYYDESGMFVVVSYGHFDDNGTWVDDIGGYYDSGVWVEGPSGYYGFDGKWIDYATEQSQQNETDSSEGTYGNYSGETLESLGSEQTGYYDQNGNWVDMSIWAGTSESATDSETAVGDGTTSGSN